MTLLGDGRDSLVRSNVVLFWSRRTQKLRTVLICRILWRKRSTNPWLKPQVAWRDADLSPDSTHRLGSFPSSLGFREEASGNASLPAKASARNRSGYTLLLCNCRGHRGVLGKLRTNPPLLSLHAQELGKPDPCPFG